MYKLLTRLRTICFLLLGSPIHILICRLGRTNKQANKQQENRKELEMWANAQRDGRPAEYRWRSLFNATKFGWRPLLDAVQ